MNFALCNAKGVKYTVQGIYYQDLKCSYKLQYMILTEEASYFDRINMTKNWLKYDRKTSQRRTLFFEYDREMFTMTNLIF